MLIGWQHRAALLLACQASQSDESGMKCGMKNGMKSGMKTDENRRALLLIKSTFLSCTHSLLIENQILNPVEFFNLLKDDLFP